MKKKLSLIVVATILFGVMPKANAAYLDVPLPNNTYITMNGLDWAWSFPVTTGHSGFPGFDLSYQSTLGWRIPTPQELLLAPLATDFMFAGANVPLGGTDPVSGAYFETPNANLTNDAACAVPYFSTSYMYCGWSLGYGQGINVWAGMPTADIFSEQLVVRGGPIPEPTTMLLLGTGLAGLAGAARRRKKK